MNKNVIGEPMAVMVSFLTEYETEFLTLALSGRWGKEGVENNAIVNAVE